MGRGVGSVGRYSIYSRAWEARSMGGWLRLRRGGDGGDGGRQSDNGCGREGDGRVRVAWGQGVMHASDRQTSKTDDAN